MVLDPIAIDFETYYAKGECDIRTLGNWAYCRHPDWEASLVSVYSEEISYVGSPKKAPWAQIAKHGTLIAHNAAFDQTVLERLVELGEIPESMLSKEWIDTADLAAYLGAPRNLAGAAKQLLNMDLDKGVRDSMEGRRAAEILANGASLEYALDDAVACYRLFTEHGSKWPSHEIA